MLTRFITKSPIGLAVWGFPMLVMRMVAGAALVAAALGFSVQAQDQVAFQPDFGTARQLAAQTRKLLVVHFWAPWCEPCLRMEHDVLGQPGLGAAVNPQFVLVKVNADREAELAKQLQVETLPTDVILAPDGRVLAKLPGSRTPAEYLERLRDVAAGGNGLLEHLAAAPAAPGIADPATGPAPGVAPPRNADFRDLQDRKSRRQPTLPYDQALPPADVPPLQGPLAPLQGSPPSVEAAVDPSASAGLVPTEAGFPPATASEHVTMHPVTPPAPSAGVVSMGAAAPEQVPLAPVDQPLADASSGLSPAQGPPAGSWGPNPSVPAPQVPAMGPQYSGGAPVAPPQGFAPTAPPPQPQLAVAPNQPPVLGLDGYCPVQLYEHYRWVPGRPQWGAIYEGHTYLFAGPQEQQMFLADPARYSPVAAGYDPVLVLEQGQQVPGRREFGVVCDGRIYLFASEASRARFEQSPDRYAAPVLTAGRPTTVR